MIGTMMQGLSFPLSAGLYLRKKTNVIALIVISIAIINLVLNYFFIPVFGIMGSAYTTLVSYFIVLFIGLKISNRFLKVPIPYFIIGKSAFFAILAGVIIFLLNIKISNSILYIMVIILLVSLIYCILLYCFEADFRYNFFKLKDSAREYFRRRYNAKIKS
jgi:O-antigen/teichoic acid export membrane protein